MFGVFNVYEQQILHDWIVTAPHAATLKETPDVVPHIFTHRAQQRTLYSVGQHTERRPRSGAARGIIRHRFAPDADGKQECNSELRLLEKQLSLLNSKEEAMQILTKLMSPTRHHTSSGLMATRVFSKLFGG